MIERNLSSAGSLSKYLEHPSLGQDDVRSLKLNLGLQVDIREQDT